MRYMVRCALASVLLALLPLVAAAVELRDFTAAEDSKRVTLRFYYTENVRPDVIYHYANNFVALRATGLRFSAARLKADVPPPSEEAALAYRFVRFQQDDEGGEVRIYLQRGLTPADAQVIPYDGYTEVVLLKPTRAADPPPAQPAEPPTQPAQTPPVETPPTVPAETPPTPPVVEEPVAEMPPAEPQPEPEPPAEEPAAEPTPPVTPAAPITGPSYTQFNLAEVPVRQVEFRGVPFREVLLELVSTSGFNVVVADEVDNSEVSLNFTQKEISLKSALDLLAMAYDFTWTVEADAIMVRAR